MPKDKKPKKIAEPGAAPDQEVQAVGATEPGESDIDAAVDAGQAGKTHKIAKAKPIVPPSKVKGDPLRKPTAAVNAKAEMPYAEAMKKKDAGELTRSVLTDRGWVVVAKPQPKGPGGA